MTLKTNNVQRFLISTLLNQKRCYKNFGHKRQPEAGVTILWHGFLTFSFIGLGLNWKWISNTLFGTKIEQGMETPLDK